MTFYVGSKSQPTLLVSVDAYSTVSGAIQFARARHRIADPIRLTSHQVARLQYQMAQEQARQLVWSTPLNGKSPMCFDNRYEPYQFD